MKGYRCDHCGLFEQGQSSQRDGDYPPEGWSTLTGIGPALHICQRCKDGVLQYATSATTASRPKR